MSMTVEDIRAKLRVANESELAALERSLSADTRKGVKAALRVARRRVDAEKSELLRVDAMYAFEREMLGSGQAVIVGLDEVGRGPIAGPLAVGAVVLPDMPHVTGLNDSKQLTASQREEIGARIKQVARAWAVEYVDSGIIDEIGITASLIRAFKGALGQVERMGIHPDVVLIDGNPLHFDDREVSVVKGDAKCASIAAASIVAKVDRDAVMCELDGEYPGYGFASNKGYGSPQHVDAVESLGLSPVHRKSFCGSLMQESLF